MVNYSGNSSAESTLQIFSAESVVYSKALKFSPEENSAVIQAELPANSIGPRTYRVELQPLESEKNVLNNRREFAVEVIDERTKVLIAYSFLHPDVGALKKAIESNQQREVEIKPISEVSDLQDYQLLILYQPDNRFKDLFSELEARSKNYFLIAGTRTDWNFLNNSQDIFTQEITNQPEEFFPAWNENFKAFQTEDIGYSGFPPLEGNFGKIEFSEGIDILLYRQIQGVDTNDPLLAIAETGGSKKAFLMGANLWRWRSAVFQERNSFEDFDRVIGNLVQFLAAGSRKERLVIHYEPLYNSSEEVILQADFFDRNYNFDPRASLEISIMNEATGDKRQVPFLLKENSYEVDLSSLEAGVYNFTVNVSGEGLSRSGTFRIMDFDVEQQFAGANFEALQEVAESKGQKVYFLNDFEAIKDQLLSDNSYATVQKSQQKDVPLIDWKYLLGIIILALSAEWFLRKYYGLI
ncbi:MAG: VWA domain-containing protein, partial [Salinimicrobium sediminis]|nr:VWA domain-containing protein [Salinimicrobium sediminis]